MELQKKVEIAEDFLKKIISLFGIQCEVKSRIEKGNIFIDISGGNSKEMGRLIGKNGHIISALQSLTEIAVNKGSTPRTSIILDVDSYMQRREQKIINDTKELANRVKKLKRPITLDPMSPWERRIVHIALQDDKEIKVESVGTGEERRIVISPA